MKLPITILGLLLAFFVKAQNPFIIKDIGEFPNSSFESNPSNIVQIDNTLFFFANDGSAAGLELWRSDGTEIGTELIADVNANTDVNQSFSSLFRGPIVLGDKVYWTSTERTQISSNDWTYQVKLWSAGKIGPPEIVKDFGVETSYSGYELVRVNDQILFSRNAKELWITDGTNAGTRLIYESGINPINELLEIDGEVYFLKSIRDTTSNYPYEGIDIWKTDGTNAGTQFHLRAMGQGVTNCKLYQIDLKKFNDKLAYYRLGFSYCSYDSHFFTEEFPTIDHSHAPIAGNGIQYPTLKDNTIYYFYEYYGSGIEYELRKQSMSENSYVKTFKDARGMLQHPNGKLIFVANEGNRPDLIDLWVSDGTEAGTESILSFDRPGPKYFSERNGQLVFVAQKNGLSSFWTTDGTTDGTKPLIDFPSTASNAYNDLRINNVLFNNKKSGAYFAGDDGVSGAELWSVNFNEPYSCPENLLSNASFESGLDHWTVASGMPYVSADPFNGDYALTMDSDEGSNAANLVQSAIAEPGATYVLSCFAKESEPRGYRGEITLKFLTNTFQPIPGNALSIESATYEAYKTWAKAPANAAYVVAEFKLPYNRDLDHSAYIDDVCLIKAENGPDCSISVEYQTTCDDKGTDENQLDDEFYFDLWVEGTHVSSFAEIVIGYDRYILGYGEILQNLGPYRIRDGNITLEVLDLGQTACSETINIEAPAPCSDNVSGCEISVWVDNFLCSDNGTTDDPLDDTFTFEVTVSGDNTGSGWESTNLPVSGQYDVPTLVGPFNVYNNYRTYISIRDLDSNSPCFANADLIRPTNCSSDNPSVCVGSVLNNGDFERGLNSTWSVDGYGPQNISLPGIAQIVPDGITGNALEICTDLSNGLFQSVAYQEVNIDPGYGNEIIVSWNQKRVSGDGLPLVALYYYDDTGNFLYSDLINPGYRENWNSHIYHTTAAVHASIVRVVFGASGGGDYGDVCVLYDDVCLILDEANTNNCEIGGEVVRIECDDNGTDSDPTDDTFTFDLLVTGTDISTNSPGWQIAGIINGLYDQIQSFGPFNIADGNIELLIQDRFDLTCQTTILVNPPNTCSDQQNNGGDLNLSISGIATNVRAYQYTSCQLELKNEGSSAMTNIHLSTNLESGKVVLRGDNPGSATKGILQDTWTNNPRWFIQRLEPGEIATAEFNLFTLTSEEITVYTQVEACEESDADSTPGNGSCCQPNEDDEAVYVFNANSSYPDLAISNVISASSGTQGEVQNLSFNLNNIGSSIASSDYTIGFYLSTDWTWSNDDVQIGEVNTGNTPIGTIPNVPASINIPANLNPGNYYLLIYADADELIQEENELNNVFFKSYMVEVANTCVIDVPDIQYVCFDNGTANDPQDDYFDVYLEVLGNQTSPTGQWILPDGSSGTFNFDESFLLGSWPHDFGNFNVILRDISGACEISVPIELPDPCSTNSGGVDLELNLSAPNLSPSNYSNFYCLLKVENLGNSVANNVRVAFSKPNEVVYQGGNEYQSSQGDFGIYSDEVWNVGTLEAGASAILTVNYFRLSGNAFTAFAQVASMDEMDIDSSPGNGTCCISPEDDEAILTFASNLSPVSSRNSVFETGSELTFLSRIYPSPATEFVKVEIVSKEELNTELEIYDVFGRMLLKKEVALQEGYNVYQLDVSEFPSGIFYVMLQPYHPYLRKGVFVITD